MQKEPHLNYPMQSTYPVVTVALDQSKEPSYDT